MISFLCPRCRVRHDLEDSRGGQEETCECGQAILVPGSPEPLPGLPIEKEHRTEYEEDEDEEPIKRVRVYFGDPEPPATWKETGQAYGCFAVMAIIFLGCAGLLGSCIDWREQEMEKARKKKMAPPQPVKVKTKPVDKNPIPAPGGQVRDR